MKAIVSILLSLFFVLGATAQESPDPTPYPGGSPFPPGKEPSLTHIVEVYWTTVDDMETHISVIAKGDRPTQMYCFRVSGSEEETIRSSIAPDCSYKICITSNMDKTDCWHIKGHGSVIVRVHGFNQEDFDNPPEVIVQYVKNGHVIGRTQVRAKPAPIKFKPTQPEKQKNEASD